MKQANVRLPVMTGDVSGVCAALYELGGMVVMHDPSGCNSTYNTHDEIRWYDQPSLIFLSGLKASDAIMGNDDKLINDIVTAATLYHPAFIAICNSPVPFIIGTDFDAISMIIEKRTGIKTFYIQTNAMHDYVYGASAALEKAVALFGHQTSAVKGDHLLVNIIGTTPLDYTNHESVTSLIRWLEDNGYDFNVNLSFGCDFAALQQVTAADVNLVVSGLGLKTAQMLERDYGMPYVAGIPVKGMVDKLKSSIDEAARTKCSCIAYARDEVNSDVLLIGDAVIMGSLGYELRARVLCPTECDKTLLTAGGLLFDGEEDLIDMIGQPGTVIGDPLYRYYMSDDIDFIELPHFALSGRLYRKAIPDLIRFDWRDDNES